MNKSFIQLLLLHFREFFREPEILFWTMVFPIVLAGILGVAFMNKGTVPQTMGLIMVEADRPFLEELSEQVTAKNTLETLKQIDAPEIRIKQFNSEADATQALKRGEILLYALLDQETKKPVFYFDPKNAEATMLYYLIDKKHTSTTSKHKIKPLITPGLRYIDFLIPGLIAMGIMQSCLWAIGWSLIDRRIKEMLRRMVATPLNRYVFLLSYLVTRVLLSMIEIMGLLFFAIVLFKIQLQGSWPAFLLLILCGNFAFSGIAILMASRAKNAQVGNGLLNAIAIPMMILSGIFFSYKNFPDWAISIVEKLPLTILADNIRKVFIEGAGLLDIAVPALGLCIFGVVTLYIGQRIFRWY